MYINDPTALGKRRPVSHASGTPEHAMQIAATNMPAVSRLRADQIANSD
jgi:hypothetical protein